MNQQLDMLVARAVAHERELTQLHRHDRVRRRRRALSHRLMASHAWLERLGGSAAALVRG